jgi:hypothetical protein
VKRAPGKAEKLIAQFEVAASDHDNLGAIPTYSGDPEEQRLIDRERKRIKGNYTRARNRLLRALEADEPLEGPTNPEPMSAEEEAFHRSKGTIT